MTQKIHTDLQQHTGHTGRAYLCDDIRTPIGRYGGGLASVRADDLAAIPIRHLIEQHPGLAQAIDEVYFGCANQSGEDNRNGARMALLLAGLPDTVPGVTINRLCASGMDAVGMACRAIVAGDIDLAIAGGSESMSRAPFVLGKSTLPYDRQQQMYDTTLGWRFINKKLEAQYGSDTMPQTGECVAKEYNISRQDQDAFAVRSQQRTAVAQANGFLSEQIMPVDVVIGRKGETVRIDTDEHPRGSTTFEALAKLKPIVTPQGSVTAGNASGINDGSCAMIVASETVIEQHGLKPRVRFISMATAGVSPRVMGLGPVPAVQKLLARTGLKIQDIDVIELNEAFASQSLACLRQLGLPDDAEHVNPNGGAIALGHPLGMSGARIIAAAARELTRRQGRYAIATMCVGVGQGVAFAMERVQ